MSRSDKDKPLGSSGLNGPTQDFAEFCELERQRRQRAGENFDAERFDRVVELVLNKLRTLEAD
ncbi:MAG: hypothetical protein H7842_11450 [Gammaproteobacteria bacterium SHHR-1]|uniref:hypothetical protein n=1 Tax=Magnetovirga frankeli TaxID=947516 RepID=UPI001293E3CF|nr:hypothetical protein D5125_00590 [gamma proteobacterium SS-5]